MYASQKHHKITARVSQKCPTTNEAFGCHIYRLSLCVLLIVYPKFDCFDITNWEHLLTDYNYKQTPVKKLGVAKCLVQK